MSSTSVQLKVADSGVAVITLDLQGSKVNLLSSATMMALQEAVAAVKANPAVKGLIICSAKADNFVAGADIKEIQALQSQSQEKAYEAAELGKQLLAEIEALPFNTVAAINGTCMGGGTEISLACKYRLATSDKKTKMSVPEVKLGFLPGWGGTVRLTTLLGVQQAIALITTGNEVDAQAAWKLGLVDEVVEPAALMERASAVALTGDVKRFPRMRRFRESLASHLSALKSPVRKFLPMVVGDLLETRLRGMVAGQVLGLVKAKSKGYLAPLEAVKVILKAAKLGRSLAAYKAESEAFARLAVTPVSRNLVNIFFAQQESKKAPSGAVCHTPIKRVGVLGAGVMGSGIAQAAAYAGYEVVLFDIAPPALEKGMNNIKSLFDGLVKRGKLTRQEADKRIAAVKPTNGYADLSGCDFVIEAIVEKMKVKQMAMAEVEKAVGKDNFIFATNTSSLSVSTMGEPARKPENVVGVHFFNPVHKMLLVEVVKGNKTSDSSLACAIAFASRLGKTTVIAKDSPGFLVNRILFPYLREAMMLMVDGVPVTEIDRAMKDFGMPMGPGELLDAVGLDIAGEVIRVGRAAFGERLSPPAILAKIEELKLLGKKGGKGIYLYDEKGEMGAVNPDVQAAITATPKSMTRSAIADRLVLAMVNEAVRCLEEEIVSDPGQLDLAMIFGTGFPPFAGGPIRYADSLGAEVVRQKLEWLYKVAGDNYKPAALLVKKAAAGESFYAK